MHLVPCSACARHVRATESSCPFCGGTPEAKAPPTPVRGRLGRAQMFALGATMTLSAGCVSHQAAYGAPPPEPPREEGVETGEEATPEEAPPPEEVAPSDGTDDPGSVHTLYGVPPEED